MKRTPLNEKPVLQWTDFCNAMYAAGFMDDSTKSECFGMRRHLLRIGRVKQIGRGLYQLDKTGHQLLAGL